MSRRVMAFLAAGALQLVALVLAHELVFLARYGSLYGEALVHAGHGAAWTTAAMTSLLLAAGLVVVGAVRLAHLATLVRRRGGGTARGGGGLELGALRDAWLRLGPRTALVGVVLLTIQENLERAVIGQQMPGPVILLTPEYAGGLWIALAVGLLVGLVAALFAWRKRVLLARLRTMRATLPRGSARLVLRSGLLALPPVESVIARRSALRAPPLVESAP